MLTPGEEKGGPTVQRPQPPVDEDKEEEGGGRQEDGEGRRHWQSKGDVPGFIPSRQYQ